MKELAYVLINPYTIRKSRTGGVIARYLSRTDLKLVAARMFGPSQALAEELYDTGVRVNVINPERTATPMRFNAFGYEPPETLLSAKKAAEISLKTLLANITGQVIDAKR